MSTVTPGQARAVPDADLQPPEFEPWMKAQGIDPSDGWATYQVTDLRVAFAAGMAAGQQPAPESGTALYLSAIARLSAGLRDVQHACDRGDSPHAVRPVAVAALADVDRLRLPRSDADELRAVIDMIWRMCQQPSRERLAERIAGLITNSGMEPF